MKKTYIKILNTSLSQAFTAVDDEEKIKKWVGEIKTDFETRDPEMMEGLKFHHKIGFFELNGEIIAYKKPLQLGVGLGNNLVKGTVFYNFEFIDSTHTKMICELEVIDAKPLQKKIVKILFPMMNKLMLRHLSQIKKIAETKNA